MLFIAGILTAIAFIGCCGASYYLGTKHAVKGVVEPVAKEKQERMKEQSESMQKILNYDIGMALRAKQEGGR